MPAGIAAAVRVVCARPPRLGGCRLVAVDGPSGSGKTHLAGPLALAIADELGGTVAPLARSGRPGHRESAPAHPVVTVVSTDLLATWEHPLDWWPILERCLLAPMAAGHAAKLPVVQWVSGNPRPGGLVHVAAADVLVLEGVSSGRIAVADRLSALVWVEVAGADVRLARAVARDGAAMRPFLARWQREEDAHFAADRTAGRADVRISPQ